MELKWLVAGLCTFEVIAITTGRVPTITKLCERFPELRRVMVTGLAMHLNDH